MKQFQDFVLLFLIVIVSEKVSAQGNNSSVNDSLFNEPFRPQFHFTPIKGWVNDPTALVYMNGLYQVNKRLAVSADLIHWRREEHPHSFSGNDSVGEMSGSAVVDINNTSDFGINGNPPLVSVWSGLRFRDIRQYQCISYSNDDGRTWINYDKNPVIDIGSTEFRDPQVCWYPLERKWVMAVALAAERKVRFYSSLNLKNWIFLSDFGPAGADNGVWECPDFFALPVDGDKQKMKWVLEVSVQPTGGQYFIGNFDGKTFTADADFINKPAKNNIANGEVLFDFEKDLSGWQTEGTAFTMSPTEGVLPMQGAVFGYEGKRLVNSFYHGDSTVGRIISPSFTITKNYINFLIGGGAHPGISINLIIQNKIVRTATGGNTEVLHWANWKVAEFKNQHASIEIVDNEKGGYGHISADEIMMSDTTMNDEVPHAFWIDYGPDYYAVRSYVNGPKNDDRRISIAWMSNWLYAHDIPTTPWKGIHTFPRSVELKTFNDGIRLVQQPIKEIAMLRDKHFHEENVSITPTSSSLNFNHDKNAYELVAEIDAGNSSDVGFNICVGDTQKTIINYNVKNKTITVDRTKSGMAAFSKFFPGVYTAPILTHDANKIKLHILVDQCSVEVFANDGEAAITCQIFPDAKSLDIQLYAANGNALLANLDVWHLKPFWKD